MRNHVEVVKMLVKYGAAVDIRNKVLFYDLCMNVRKISSIIVESEYNSVMSNLSYLV